MLGTAILRLSANFFWLAEPFTALGNCSRDERCCNASAHLYVREGHGPNQGMEKACGSCFVGTLKAYSSGRRECKM